MQSDAYPPVQYHPYFKVTQYEKARGGHFETSNCGETNYMNQNSTKDLVNLFFTVPPWQKSNRVKIK